MAKIVTTQYGTFRPDVLAEWMLGDVYEKNRHEVVIVNIDATNSFSFQGMYSGSFTFKKWGQILGEVDQFKFYYKTPEYRTKIHLMIFTHPQKRSSALLTAQT